MFYKIFFVFLFLVVNLFSCTKFAIAKDLSGVQAALIWYQENPLENSIQFKKYILNCSSFYDTVFSQECIKKHTSGKLKSIILSAQNDYVENFLNIEFFP